MLSSGRFARLSGLTVKALRHYDELGLLRPAEDQGYLCPEQVGEADVLGDLGLRGLRLPLDEIAVNPGNEPDPAQYRTLIVWPVA